MEIYVPYIMEHLLSSTSFDPAQLIAQLVNGRVNAREIESYLEAKDVDWDSFKQEQRLLEASRFTLKMMCNNWPLSYV